MMTKDATKHTSCIMHPIGDEVFGPRGNYQASPKTICDIEPWPRLELICMPGSVCLKFLRKNPI